MRKSLIAALFGDKTRESPKGHKKHKTVSELNLV